MDFNFLLRGIFTVLVGAVCYYLVEVYKELKTVRKKLDEIEKHLERTNEAASELESPSFPNDTTFDVQLKSFGSRMVPIVKEVRAITGLGLRETKELVESAPVVIQKRVNHAEAGSTKKRLEALGAIVEIVQTQLV